MQEVKNPYQASKSSIDKSSIANIESLQSSAAAFRSRMNQSNTFPILLLIIKGDRYGLRQITQSRAGLIFTHMVVLCNTLQTTKRQRGTSQIRNQATRHQSRNHYESSWAHRDRAIAGGVISYVLKSQHNMELIATINHIMIDTCPYGRQVPQSREYTFHKEYIFGSNMIHMRSSLKSQL